MTLCARGHRAYVSSLGLHRTIIEGPRDRFHYVVGPCEDLPVSLHLAQPSPQRPILTLCCRCGATIREGEPDAQGRVSHGLCAACEPLQREDWGLSPSVRGSH